MTKRYCFIAAALAATLVAKLALAENASEAKPPVPEDEAWKPTIQKTFSDKEKQDECRKYEGKYIGYYSQIYYVEHCLRREVTDPDVSGQVTSLGVISISSSTMIKLAEGKVLEELKSKKLRPCKTFEKEYVTYGGGDVFFVDKCKKHAFADWETFLAHRKAAHRTRNPVLEISRAEFDALESGPEIPSVLTKIFRDLLEGTADAQVIPIDEACKGINGKYVTYYSKIYKIEHCKKRELDPEEFLKKNSSTRFTELSSDQWLSIPDGKPL